MLSICCFDKGLNYFLSGRTFSEDGRKIFEKSWQHWKVSGPVVRQQSFRQHVSVGALMVGGGGGGGGGTKRFYLMKIGVEANENKKKKRKTR